MNMTEAQRHLFALPRSEQFRLTIEQRKVVDWVAYNEGRFTAVWPGRLCKASLRKLIGRKLIKCTAYSPARYMLTDLGRMVRGQHVDRRRALVAEE